MFQIQSGPPEDHLIGAPRLRRAPAKGALVGWITCEQQAGSYTHHWHGHTHAHDHKKCEMCDAGCRLDWHGYLACYDDRTREEYVIEITPPPGRVAQTWFDREGPLRGLKFKLFRTTEKSNGRVMIQFEPRSHNNIALPNAINLEAYLERLWGKKCIARSRSPERGGTINHYHEQPEEVAKKIAAEKLQAEIIRDDIEKQKLNEEKAGERFLAERQRRAATNGTSNSPPG